MSTGGGSESNAHNQQQQQQPPQQLVNYQPPYPQPNPWQPYMHPPQVYGSFQQRHNKLFNWEHGGMVLVILALFFTLLYYQLDMEAWTHPCRNVSCGDEQHCKDGVCVNNGGKDDGKEGTEGDGSGEEGDGDGSGGDGSEGDGGGGGGGGDSGSGDGVCEKGKVPFLDTCVDPRYKCHDGGAISVLVIYLVFMFLGVLIVSRSGRGPTAYAYMDWLYIAYCIIQSLHLCLLINDWGYKTLGIFTWDKAKYCSWLVIAWVVVNIFSVFIFGMGLIFKHSIPVEFAFMLAFYHLGVLIWAITRTCMCGKIKGTGEKCIFPYCPNSDEVWDFIMPLASIMLVPVIGGIILAFEFKGKPPDKDTNKDTKEEGETTAQTDKKGENEKTTTQTGKKDGEQNTTNTDTTPAAKTSHKEEEYPDDVYGRARKLFDEVYTHVRTRPITKKFNPDEGIMGDEIFGRDENSVFAIQYEDNGDIRNIVIHDPTDPVQSEYLQDMENYDKHFPGEGDEA